MKSQQIVVSAFIHHDGKILLAQRAADEDFLPNVWEQVGGKLEWGENPYDGLVREVKEEVGITVKPLYPYFVSHYTPDDERHLVEIAFICEVVGNAEVKLSSEHQAYAWITAEEVKVRPDMTDFMKEEILAGFDFISGKRDSKT
jgi:8-oxo-dGTP diphosphatase